MSNKYEHPAIGEWLRAAMVSLDISQNTMSRSAHMSKKSLEDLFKGKMRD